MRNPLKRIGILALSVLCISACVGNPLPTASAPAAATSTDQPPPVLAADENIILPPSSPPPVPKSDDAIPLIFSHDGAPDDIATMVYLTNHPDINVIGVIQSYGEQRPTRSLDKWQRFIYDVLNYDSVPIGVGAVSSLDPAAKQFPETWRAGADDFWGISLPDASSDHPHFNGADLLFHLLDQAPQPVVLLVTGAQTDIAILLSKNPGITNKIARVVIMGGAFNVPGNLGEASGHADNTAAEWNIFVDALAAKQVFNAGIPITVVSLDGSNDIHISRSDLERISGSTKPGMDVLIPLWEQSLKWSGGPFKIWDIVAAVAVTDPQHFTWEYDALDVIAEPGSTHGQTIALGIGSDNARYSFTVDGDAIRTQIFTILQ